MPSGRASRRDRLAATTSLQRLRSRTGPPAWWRLADPPCGACARHLSGTHLPGQDGGPHCPPWHRILAAAGTVPLAGGAGAVVDELLAPAAGPLGSRCRAAVRVCAAGVCPGVLQPALIIMAWLTTSRGTPR